MKYQNVFCFVLNLVQNFQNKIVAKIICKKILRQPVRYKEDASFTSRPTQCCYFAIIYFYFLKFSSSDKAAVTAASTLISNLVRDRN